MTPARGARLPCMDSPTRTVRVAPGVQLCVQDLGPADAPALLLLGGFGWSMDAWDDALCARLVARGRRVLRYDQRDTGRSTTWPAGAPAYAASDLLADAVAVLDACGVARAHVVGLSAGGGLAQHLALRSRDRVATLTLVSTSPVGPDAPDLPGTSPALLAALAAAPPLPDASDRAALVDAVVEGERPYAGREFDETRARALAERVVDRSTDLAASLTNHPLAPDDLPADVHLADLAGLPTLVVHGTADPVFPPAHGRALAAAVPGARLLELDGVGHELPPPRTWDVLVDALIALTSPPPGPPAAPPGRPAGGA